MNNPVDQPKVSELDARALKAASDVVLSHLAGMTGLDDMLRSIAHEIQALAAPPQPTVGVKALEEIASYAGQTLISVEHGNPYSVGANAAFEAVAAIASAALAGISNAPLPFGRDELGRMVREAWVRWAQTQPSPKPSWLVPYAELSEADKEADRQIGEAISRWTIVGMAAGRSNSQAPAPTSERVQALSEALAIVEAGINSLDGGVDAASRRYSAAIRALKDAKP